MGEGRSARQRRRAGHGWIPLLSILTGLVGTLVLLFGGAAPGGAASRIVASGSAGGCSVTLSVDEAQLTAHAQIASGCNGPHYYFASWTAQSDIYRKSFPQSLFDWVGQGSNWTVNLPPCFWQIDFSWRTAPPGQPAQRHYIVVSQLGGVTCNTTTTSTTIPTTTTSSTSTTSTTIPTTTTSSTSTTSTTIPTTTTSSTSTTSTTIATTTTSSTIPTTTTSSTIPTTTVAPTTTTLAPTSSTAPQQSTTSTVPVPTSSSSGQGSTTTTAPAGSGSSPQSPSPTALAFTGFAAVIVAALALGLLACGFILVQASRRRSTSRG